MMIALLKEDQDALILQLDEIHLLEEIEIPDVSIVRRGLDKGHVEDLMYSQLWKWPPILVTRTEIGYMLLDGYHRVEARKRLKEDLSIRAECRTFKSWDDVIERIYDENMKHGLKVSRESRSEFAYWYWKKHPNLTHQNIADRCGLERSAVSHVIARREEKKHSREQAIIDEAKKRADIPQLIVPGTPPDEEVKRQAIIKTTRTLTGSSTKLLEHLHDVHQDQLRIMGMTGTLEMVRKSLLEAVRAVDERQVAGMAEVTAPRTPPDEEIRREEIVKAANALSDDSQRLSEYLQKVGEDKLRAAGITATLEAVHKRLEDSIHIIDEILRRPQEEAPGAKDRRNDGRAPGVSFGEA